MDVCLLPFSYPLAYFQYDLSWFVRHLLGESPSKFSMDRGGLSRLLLGDRNVESATSGGGGG